MSNFSKKIIYFLKNGMNKTMRSYDRFTSTNEEQKDSGEFQKHHAACKQAIAHLESLLKLYEKNMASDNADKDSVEKDKKSDEGKNLQSLIDQACVRIRNDNKNIK